MRSLLARAYAAPYLLLTLTSLFWAGNSIAGKLAIGAIGPMTLTTGRWFGVVLLLALFARHDWLNGLRVTATRWRWTLAMGALGYTSFNALLYIAAYHTSAVNITLLQGALPVFVILGGLIAFGTRISRLQTIGVIVTMVGVALIASHGDLTSLAGLGFNIGDVYMLIACVLYAGYTQGLRARPPVSGLGLFASFASVALVMSLPLVAIEIARGEFIMPTPAGWLILAYVTLFPSLASQLFYIRGVELIGPARAGLFINLIPVFGALMAVAILGEPFGWHHALALALVLGGIVLAETGKQRA